MKHQFMPMFWGDFFANTLNLTTATEIGAYVLLLGHAWEHGGRILHKDACKVARLDNRHWQRIRGRLEPFFEFETDIHGKTWMVSKRILRELAIADELINKRKASGMAGAIKRWGKDMANAMPVAWQPQCDTNGNLPKKERKKEKLTTEPRARDPVDNVDKSESGEHRLGEARSHATAPPAGALARELPPPRGAKKPSSQYSLAELMKILDRKKRNGKANRE